MSLESTTKNKLPNPIISPWKNPDEWILVESYDISGVVIPNGFVSDLDSIPRIPGMYALFKGRARRSAILHDWHYYKEEIPRKEADVIFYENMLLEGVGQNIAWAMYLAVRLCGSYNK